MFDYIHNKLEESITFHWAAMKLMSLLGGSRSKVVGQLTGTYGGSLTCVDNRTGKTYNVPIVNNSIPAVAFKEMTAPEDDSNRADHAEDGIRVFDSGFRNTAVMESKITFVDGKKGKIQYRACPVTDLVGQKKYEEIAYYLCWASFPAEKERMKFQRALAAASVPPQSAVDTIRSMPRDTPPLMSMIVGSAAYISSKKEQIPSYVGKNLYMGNMPAVDKEITETLGYCAALVALVYCHQHNMEFTQPDPNESYVYNLLLMMGKVDPETKKPYPKHIDCLERLWVLYADHEMTNSTAAFLHTASSLADPVSCGIAGMASAYGPLHGGAIPTAYKSMSDLGGKENVPQLIESVKAKKQRLYGYGHRIYKTTDPRSKIIRDILDELCAEGPTDPILETAFEIDRIASSDEYFTSRKLAANADLFGSFVYTALYAS
ncbi:MAG: hypothetical protein M4579_002998 [Chaenotheca gracillima]|nr:MAG: hypothetical protein M4579_002998 [Chaenotheca gracillima]